jgi:hypothetical protein
MFTARVHVPYYAPIGSAGSSRSLYLGSPGTMKKPNNLVAGFFSWDYSFFQNLWSKLPMNTRNYFRLPLTLSLYHAFLLNVSALFPHFRWNFNVSRGSAKFFQFFFNFPIDTLTWLVYYEDVQRDKAQLKRKVEQMAKREYNTARAEANSNYDSKTYKSFLFKLRIEEDADIIQSILEAQGNGINKREWLREQFEGK